MKAFFTYFLLFFVLSSFTNVSGSQGLNGVKTTKSSNFGVTSINEVVNGLKTGNASKLSRYFDNTIDITLSDKSNSYSRSQAELVLKDFFTTNVVVNFVLIHTGDNSGSQYLIGNLQTRRGTYRTTIYIKQKADGQMLQELRFER